LNSKIFHRFVENLLQFLVDVVSPEDVLVNLDFSEFDALLDGDKTELVGLLSESNELFFVIVFIHEGGDGVDHFRDCAEAIAKTGFWE
jgi:hypothetical protein